MEEVLQNILGMNNLQEKRLLSYLNLFANQFLYQKTGFLISRQPNRYGVSDDFFTECKKQIGKSKRYLTRDIKEGIYIDEWKMIVPRQLSIKNGVTEDAAI